MVRSGALLGAISLCLSLAGCSFVLDFTSADESDAAVNRDGPDPCALFEPNDDLADAVQIDPGTYDLGICPAGESDFFQFTVMGANSDVTIQITFSNTNGGGDLDLRLFDDGAVIDVSEGFGDEEMISRTAGGGNSLDAGDYVIQVFPFSPMIQNNYTLTLTVMEDMTPDAGVPDAMPLIDAM